MPFSPSSHPLSSQYVRNCGTNFCLERHSTPPLVSCYLDRTGNVGLFSILGIEEWKTWITFTIRGFDSFFSGHAMFIFPPFLRLARSQLSMAGGVSPSGQLHESGFYFTHSQEKKFRYLVQRNWFIETWMFMNFDALPTFHTKMFLLPLFPNFRANSNAKVF